MKTDRKKITKIALAVILLFLIFSLHFFYSVRKIDLVSSDASRHLKNGELMSESFFQGTNLWKDILYKNVYSYTAPDHSFINHHWASSIIFFYVWKLGGFYGLSIFNILLRAIILFMVILIAYRLSNFWIAAITTLALLPIASTRAEIRIENEEKWENLCEKYQFRTIVMQNNQKDGFIHRRKDDPNWSVAFENDKFIVFKPAGQKPNILLPLNSKS